MHHTYTDAEEAYLVEHYPHIGAEQCARILKRSLKAVQSKVLRMGLVCPPRHTSADQLDAQITKMASRSNGFRGCEIEGKTSQVVRSLRRLMEAGKLIRVKIRYKKVSYFAHQKDADKVQEHAPSVTIRSHSKRTGWGPDVLPYFDPLHPPKITIAPTPPRCWHTNTHGSVG